MNNNFDCGKRIKELRTARGLSQEELAFSADITTSYLGMLERGEKNPTVKVIEKICNALKIELCDFFNKEVNVFTLTKSKNDEKILCLLNLFSEEQKEIITDIIHQILKLKKI